MINNTIFETFQIKDNSVDVITSKDLIDYSEAMEIMRFKTEQIKLGNASDTIWILQHNHVFTCGVSSSPEDMVTKSGIETVSTNRGGRSTYHGPGQIIAYIMINLVRRYGTKADIRKYVSSLENIIIQSLAKCSIVAQTIQGAVGVWVKNKNKSNTMEKIAAIGIRASKLTTSHGIAINVCPDLSKFNEINPCGIKDGNVCSMQSIGALSADVTLESFQEILKKSILDNIETKMI